MYLLWRYSSWTFTRFSALHFLRHMWLFARRSDFLKEIRRRRSGRRRFSSLSFWFRLFMLRRLLWCGGRHRVSSNHLYRRAAERERRVRIEIRLHFLRARVRLSVQATSIIEQCFALCAVWAIFLINIKLYFFLRPHWNNVGNGGYYNLIIQAEQAKRARLEGLWGQNPDLWPR